MSSAVATSPIVPVAELTWGEACAAIIDGRKVTRKAWGNDDCVFLHAGIIHLRKTDGTLHQLAVSEGDLLGTDWIVVREN